MSWRLYWHGYMPPYAESEVKQEKKMGNPVSKMAFSKVRFLKKDRVTRIITKMKFQMDEVVAWQLVTSGLSAPSDSFLV
jgi:hypothetical protein